MTAYLCSSRNALIENHHPEECVYCLRAMRDEWKRLANSDLVSELRILQYRIRCQRKELARLNGG